MEALYDTEKERRRLGLPRSWSRVFEDLEDYGDGVIVLLDSQDLEDYQKAAADFCKKHNWDDYMPPSTPPPNYPIVYLLEVEHGAGGWYGSELVENLWGVRRIAVLDSWLEELSAPSESTR